MHVCLLADLWWRDGVKKLGWHDVSAAKHGQTSPRKSLAHLCTDHVLFLPFDCKWIFCQLSFAIMAAVFVLEAAA